VKPSELEQKKQRNKTVNSYCKEQQIHICCQVKPKLCLKLNKQYLTEMVTGVTAANMTNVLGTAVVPAQLKETPLKSDRRVSVFSGEYKIPKKKNTSQKPPRKRIKSEPIVG